MKPRTPVKIFDEFIKFRPLTGVDEAQLSPTFDRIAKSLSGSAFEGTVRFQLWTATEKHVFTLAMKEGKGTVQQNSKGSAAFEIITTPETWLSIARGEVSPLEAFTRGKMRVRGDISLGQQILKRLAATQEGRVDVC